jgi:hypothetical protein
MPSDCCAGQSCYFLVLRAAFLGASVTDGFAWSPMMPLSGQILKAGHFAQPVTTAIGQSVMVISSNTPKRASMREPAGESADFS